MEDCGLFLIYAQIIRFQSDVIAHIKFADSTYSRTPWVYLEIREYCHVDTNMAFVV